MLIIKKINAVLGLGAILALAAHGGTMGYSLLTSWYNYAICKTLAHAALALFICHIAVSLLIFFFCHDGAELRSNWRLNGPTIVQRASALAMLLLIHLHVKDFTFIVAGASLSAGQKAGKLVIEVLFRLCLAFHVSISVSKSLITLGVVASEKTVRRIDKAARVVVFALAAVAFFAMARFVLGWMV